MDSSHEKSVNSGDSPAKTTKPLAIAKMSTSKGLLKRNPNRLSRKASWKPIEGQYRNIERTDPRLFETAIGLCQLSEQNASRNDIKCATLTPHEVLTPIPSANQVTYLSAREIIANEPCDQSQLAGTLKCMTKSTPDNYNETNVSKIARAHTTTKYNLKNIVESEHKSSSTSLSSQDLSGEMKVDVENFSISEFDPLHGRKPSSKFMGISNRQILDKIIVEDTNDSEDSQGNESKQICIRGKNFCRSKLEDKVITIPESQESAQIQPSSEIMACPVLKSEVECVTIEDSQQDAESRVYEPPSPVPEAGTSAAGPIPQIKIVNVTSFLSQDSDIQIIDEVKPSTSKSKSSPMSKFKKIFGVSKPELKLLQRPAVNDGPPFNGCLTWVADDNLVLITKALHCVIAEKKIFCYTDSVTKVLKEVYKLNNITSLQIVLPVECSSCLYSFELGLLNSESSDMKHSPRSKITFGCATAAERRTWTQKIATNLTSAFPVTDYSDFTRLGWCFLKVGVSGEWLAAWLLLAGRQLMYYCSEDVADNVDLRKARCIDIIQSVRDRFVLHSRPVIPFVFACVYTGIPAEDIFTILMQNLAMLRNKPLTIQVLEAIQEGTQIAEEDSKKACPSECSANLLLDCSVTTLYLRFPHIEEFQNWNCVLTLAAHTNGLGLYEQQLTHEEVPTIVDKCINFIYAYGVLSEGIYRRAGSSIVLAELLTKFRADAWSVQLTPQIYSEHDVAGVFKRFFRDLPTPLISRECHERLLTASAIEDECDRLVAYQHALDGLDPVSFNTARRLFAHLNFIHNWNEVNKMSAENLAAVWAPTIIPPCVRTAAPQMLWSENEVPIVRDIIINYQGVWCADEDEIQRDLACHRVVMRMQESARPLPQPSSAGDLRFWVLMDETSNHFQVTLTPDKTSADLCIELSVKTNIPYHNLMLEEQICNNSMKRIVHKDEIVLDVVTRWGYWDEEDRKDNNLVVKRNILLHQLDAKRQMDGNDNLEGTVTCGQLRYANDTSKKFKTYVFEVSSSKLSGFADEQGSSKVEEWNVSDIVWYFGHEAKRDPQCLWAITFIPKDKKKRSKERPYFGHTIAGGVVELQLQWATALMFAEHKSILPVPHDFFS